MRHMHCDKCKEEILSQDEEDARYNEIWCGHLIIEKELSSYSRPRPPEIPIPTMQKTYELCDRCFDLVCVFIEENCTIDEGNEPCY